LECAAPAPSDDALDGVGRVRHRLDLVGIGPDQLDLHASAADVDTARLVDLVARHFGACPVVFALHESHGAEDGDLDGALRRGDGCNEREGDCRQCRAQHGVSSSFTL